MQISVDLLDNGNLKIKFLNMEQEKREKLLKKLKNNYFKIESQICNLFFGDNGLQFLHPDEHGDLSDAPMITDLDIYSDPNDYSREKWDSHIWIFTNYMTEDWIESLLETGEIIFIARKNL